jgi:hypothetical protein
MFRKILVSAFFVATLSLFFVKITPVHATESCFCQAEEKHCSTPNAPDCVTTPFEACLGLSTATFDVHNRRHVIAGPEYDLRSISCPTFVKTTDVPDGSGMGSTAVSVKSCTHYSDQFCKNAIAESVAAAAAAQAQAANDNLPTDTIKPIISIKKPVLEILIPNLTFSDIKSTTDENGNIQIPWIGEYIAAVYRLAVTVASILSVILIIREGALIAVSGGGEEKINGLRNIGRIIAGLILAWSSYVILYNINASLVSFRPLDIKFASSDSFLANNEDESEDQDNQPVIPTAGAITLTDDVYKQPLRPEDIISVKGEFMANSMRMNRAVAQELIDAAADLYTATKDLPGGPYKLKGGSYRSLQDQVAKWVKNCEGKPKCDYPPIGNPFPRDQMLQGNIRKPGAVPDPNCCAHTRGLAFDIYCYNYDIDRFFVPCQLALEKIMLQRGFCRLNTEPWHFEKPKHTSTCGNFTGTIKYAGEVLNYSSCTGIFAKTGKGWECTPR